MQVTRQNIINAARKLVGTPYQHQGRLSSQGLDCVGLLTSVATTVGIDFVDFVAYERHSDGVTLCRELGRNMRRIPLRDARPGDVIVFWIRRKGLAQHLAIRSDYGLIHTWSDIGKVVEHLYDDRWQRHAQRAYCFHQLMGVEY